MGYQLLRGLLTDNKYTSDAYLEHIFAKKNNNPGILIYHCCGGLVLLAERTLYRNLKYMFRMWLHKTLIALHFGEILQLKHFHVS